VARGRTIFVERCAGCHSVDFKRDDPNREIRADMKDVGTDVWMAKNFRTREGDTGKLKGTRVNFKLGGARFLDKASGESMLVHAVIGTVVGSWKDAPPDELEGLKLREPILKADGLDAYKARPLNGIWATAPYLHNGSVPTLRDLLKPAKSADPTKQRPVTFWVGSRKFNPKDVGFETSEIKGRSKLFDTALDGNSNQGHEYGTGVSQADGGDGTTLDERQIDDLLEYLKSL
jgi:cytochrome c peroxidase